MLNLNFINYLVCTANQGAGGGTALAFQPLRNPQISLDDETDRSLQGQAPQPFKGDQSKVLEFLRDFNNYWIINDNNTAMKSASRRVATFLSYLEGDRIRDWKDEQLRKLQDRVAVLGYHRNDKELWEIVKRDFTQTYVDTALKELTGREFNRLKQKGEEIDNYIAKFNNYSTRLEYDRNSPLLVDKFCEGLNKGVHIDIMRQDIWPETLDWWQEAA